MSVQTTSAASGVPPQGSLRMTFAAFLDWLDEDTHAEWVNGEVIMHSPVSYRHNSVGGFLISLMRIFTEERDLGAMSFDPFQMKTAPRLPSRAPDIIFVAKANLHRLKANLLEGPADLVVEIVSPESCGRDRGDKFYEYEEGGVREYWIIDPERRQAEFYLLGVDGRYALAAPDSTSRYHSTVLLGLFIDLDWLWQATPPQTREILRLWD